MPHLLQLVYSNKKNIFDVHKKGNVQLYQGGVRRVQPVSNQAQSSRNFLFVWALHVLSFWPEIIINRFCKSLRRK